MEVGEEGLMRMDDQQVEVEIQGWVGLEEAA